MGDFDVVPGKAVVPDTIQRDFILFQEGSALLQAPVGTGKTLALALRVAEAIKTGIAPEHILCVTFTNRAADELRQRVATECGAESRKVAVRTFHGLCAWMLRAEAKQLGLPADFVIYDDDDSLDILRDSAKELGFNLRADNHNNEAGKLLAMIADAKTYAPRKALTFGSVPERAFVAFHTNSGRVALAYQNKLIEHHALDYADLIYFTRAMLYTKREIYERWSRRFRFIQVDEMQDTHMSEYQVLRILAQGSKNLVLVGDFDQTIYEWRGSDPEQVLGLFARDFPASRRFAFITNYRSTGALVEVATNVVMHYSAKSELEAANAAAPGSAVICHFAADGEKEAHWIAAKIRSLRDSYSASRIGVLTRTNQRAGVVSRAFSDAGLPHVTVEQFDFFRRQEVKDAVAYLRYLFNPFDAQSLHRILLRPTRSIGARTIEKIRAAENTGLRLTDMTRTSTLAEDDPFSTLVQAWSRRLVIFDTETTGLNPASDEIVEIAALRMVEGRVDATFHRYLKNHITVGETVHVHGHSDEFLAEAGEDAALVLAEFCDFISGSHLVGHNIAFDMRMMAANLQRLGLPALQNDFSDTLDLARRFLITSSYSLGDLAEQFGFDNKPTHQAMADVLATRELLDLLIPHIEKQREARNCMIKEFGALFLPLATEISELRSLASVLRPADLLEAVLKHSGLEEYYAKDSKRATNLEELLALFRHRDDNDLDPLSALENLLHFTALARNIDRIESGEEKVRVLTVHQAKGLEFDLVFVAGLSKHEFPGYFAVKEGREAEELRVFYVAVTRARQQLILTGHAKHNGKPRDPSPYFAYIGDNWLEEDSTVLRRHVMA